MVLRSVWHLSRLDIHRTRTNICLGFDGELPLEGAEEHCFAGRLNSWTCWKQRYWDRIDSVANGISQRLWMWSCLISGKALIWNGISTRTWLEYVRIKPGDKLLLIVINLFFRRVNEEMWHEEFPVQGGHHALCSGRPYRWDSPWYAPFWTNVQKQDYDCSITQLEKQVPETVKVLRNWPGL